MAGSTEVQRKVKLALQSGIPLAPARRAPKDQVRAPQWVEAHLEPGTPSPALVKDLLAEFPPAAQAPVDACPPPLALQSAS